MWRTHLLSSKIVKEFDCYFHCQESFDWLLIFHWLRLLTEEIIIRATMIAAIFFPLCETIFVFG